ncbi:MAG: response regulator [Ignavibacteriales bacterium]|nr:response regulator [Ignavibacteriales bacterium]
MKTLIVEDDFVSRTVLDEILEPYGKRDVAVNGKEAVEAFGLALEKEEPYDLVCLDIMIPELTGQEALVEMRKIEEANNVPHRERAKVVMTTALGDFDNIKTAFKEQCEAYLVKPLNKKKVTEALANIGIVPEEQ